MTHVSDCLQGTQRLGHNMMKAEAIAAGGGTSQEMHMSFESLSL